MPADYICWHFLFVMRNFLNHNVLTGVLSKIHCYMSLIKLCAIALLLIPMPIYSATQGSQGNTSSGTVEINIVKNRTILIIGLRDFNFGQWTPGDGTLTDNDNLCVGKTNFGTYGIRASGNGDGFDPAAFTLSNGSDQIYYNVYWNDAATPTGTNAANQLTPGLIQHGQVESFFHTFFFLFGACFENANLEIEIPDTELLSSTGGNYTGTLTLLVIPD